MSNNRDNNDFQKLALSLKALGLSMPFVANKEVFELLNEDNNVDANADISRAAPFSKAIEVGIDPKSTFDKLPNIALGKKKRRGRQFVLKKNLHRAGQTTRESFNESVAE